MTATVPGTWLVEIEHLRKTYAATAGSAPAIVLDDVSLRVAPGEFVALVGASGSGKTTLLNLTGGLDLPDAGTIRVDGHDLGGLDDDARSRFRLRSLGFVFQFFNLLPNLSVRENVALPLLLLGRPEPEANAAAERTLAEIGLGGKITHAVHQLSGGEMQRTAIARALVHRPRLLLADEPTGNLDSRTGGAILALIRESAERHGLTVLMATHDPMASAVADRVVRMRDGRIEATIGVDLGPGPGPVPGAASPAP